MTWPLVLKARGRADVDEAYQYYESQRPGLGDEFLAEVEVVYARLRVMPQVHQTIFRDLRRDFVHRFPYGVFYRIKRNRVEVVAVYNLRRDPRG